MSSNPSSSPSPLSPYRPVSSWSRRSSVSPAVSACSPGTTDSFKKSQKLAISPRRILNPGNIRHLLISSLDDGPMVSQSHLSSFQFTWSDSTSRRPTIRRFDMLPHSPSPSRVDRTGNVPSRACRRRCIAHRIRLSTTCESSTSYHSTSP